MLERIADAVSGKLPNCEQALIRHFEMRIGRDGTWFYQGSPINRIRLVKLFSTVLRRESDGRYWLVTPVERGIIDAAYRARMTHVAWGIHETVC